PTNGVLNLNSNGSFTYTSFTNFTGTDAFTYRVDDGVTNSTAAKVTLTVTPNFAPTATNDSYSVVRNNSLTVTAPGVLANDADANGDPLTVFPTTGPTNGVLNLSSNGSFTYTPNTNYVGVDNF